MANTKITLGNIADDAIGIDQLNIGNSYSSGQVLGYSASNNYLQWETVSGGVTGISSSADATAITINSSEQVGIGITSPSCKLNVVDTSSADATVLRVGNGYTTDATGDASTIMFQLYRSYSAGINDSGFIKSVKEQAWDATDDRDAALVFGTRDGSSNPVERMRIKSDGTIGVGTASPSNQFTIYRSGSETTASIHSNGQSELRFVANNAANTWIQAGTGPSSSQVPMYLTGMYGTNNTMTIDSANARVGIGTTTPSQKLHVVSNAQIGNILLQGNSSNSIISAGNANIKVSSLEFTGGAGNLDFDIYLAITGGIQRVFQVEAAGSGDTYTNDGTISSLSDERIKTDINDLADGLDIVKQLRPVTFKYNDTTEDEDGKHDFGYQSDKIRYGFIAQEVEAVAPQYVETSTRKINNEEVDDFKSLSTTRMIPMLFKAIQEQQTIIDDLKTRIETLENA